MKVLLIGSAKSRERFIADFNKNTIEVDGQKIKIEFIAKNATIILQKKPYLTANFAIFLDELDADCARALNMPTTLYIFEEPDSPDYEYPEIFLKNYIRCAKEYAPACSTNFFFKPNTPASEIKLPEDQQKNILK